MLTLSHNTTIAVVGLGYVGLPVALALSKIYRTIGFDLNPLRVRELSEGIDYTGEVDPHEVQRSRRLSLTDNLSDLADSDVFVVTVPTPIDEENEPDLTALRRASSDVGSVMRRGCVVVFESTVFPGATEEICVPLMEKASGLILNQDFYVGYSPERINPGDEIHRLASVIKITSGSNDDCAEFVDQLYRSIVTAGTYKAPSIQVAEAAKVIENIQRDLNIALVNEFARVFERMDIDTGDVLAAASTKWNFLSFKPGLVGGHCIGVDPYYLTYKANLLNYNPEVILAGRKINNDMPRYIGTRVEQLMTSQRISMNGARILVLGITFKENCPDIRNSKAVDLVAVFQELGAHVDVFDPVVATPLAKDLAHLNLVDEVQGQDYDALVAAVAHTQFTSMSVEFIKSLVKENSVIYDVKHMLEKSVITARL